MLSKCVPREENARKVYKHTAIIDGNKIVFVFGNISMNQQFVLYDARVIFYADHEAILRIYSTRDYCLP